MRWTQKDLQDALARGCKLSEPIVTPIIPEREEVTCERDLQAKCEKHLDNCGYKRLTSENVVCHEGSIGWYGHLVEAKRNMFCADLIVMRKSSKLYTQNLLMVELKHPDEKGKVHYGIGQEKMITNGWWHLATNLKEFKTILTNWEKEL